MTNEELQAHIKAIREALEDEEIQERLIDPDGDRGATPWKTIQGRGGEMTIDSDATYGSQYEYEHRIKPKPREVIIDGVIFREIIEEGDHIIPSNATIIR